MEMGETICDLCLLLGKSLSHLKAVLLSRWKCMKKVNLSRRERAQKCQSQHLSA